MLKLFTGIFLLVSIVGKSQAYIPLLGENKNWEFGYWEVEGCDTDMCWYDFILLEGDTVIDGELYQHFGSEYLYGDIYLREDTSTQRVYRYIYDEHQLLYDFSLSIGDTTEIFGPFIGNSTCSVMDVDSITTIDGIQRKRMFVTIGWWESTWIEGIGNLERSLLFQGEGNGLWTRLLCYSEGGLELMGIDCGPLGINELAVSQLNLFPNPISSTAFLDLGDLRGIFTLEIFDIKGQMMRRQILNIESGTTFPSGSGQALNLKRGELSSGQYLLRLSNEEESYELPFVVE